MAEIRILDVVGHPVRLRILHEVADRERTTAQLREALPDVTPATLYRHVGALLDAGVLTVVAERKVRGATERTLAAGPRDAHADLADLEALGAGGLRQIFLTLLAHLSGQMDRFLQGADPDLLRLSGASQTVLHVDLDDLAALQQEMSALLTRYREPGPDKHRVTLTSVLVPDP
ncbi:helix-turn-helix domain-containing protein [Ornithinicoccus hortensis]|uniref:DNA-binding HxlR family transcriptional regulator n=1 Tax=Ornithinicoccus hortensis TaxID=82346 RepID=A0A542YU12_9MICO|nr:helix-turn-helix domain-containing protein [Ornithinicoccus hortensis]TQL51579.1 DNA-binding HxlR family transcriptional regulator [Ornithinicoccus hortensis]